MMIISVDGNIASGKSTFLKKISNKINETMKCIPIFEPIPKKYLNHLYENIDVWAYPFQLIMATERKICYNQALELNKNNDCIIFLERTLETDTLFANVAITDRESKEKYNIYKNEILKDVAFPPDIYIYLKSNPYECINRIEQRQRELKKENDDSRECERIIDIGYLNKIHNEHEKYFDKKKEKGYTVLKYNTEILNWSSNENTINNIANEIIKLKRG